MTNEDDEMTREELKKSLEQALVAQLQTLNYTSGKADKAIETMQTLTNIQMTLKLIGESGTVNIG